MQKGSYILSFLVALIFVLLGAFFPWFSLPTGGRSQDSSVVEMAYRLLSLVLSLSVLGLYLKSKTKFKSDLSRLLSLFFLLFLLFPFCLQYFSPIQVSKAAWLNSQHQNLSWLGGDIYTAQEYVRYGFKSKILVVDSPREIAVFPFPYWNSETFSLGTINEVVNWLGYSSHFCQFAKPGFFLSVIGCLVLQFLSLREGQEINFTRASKILKTNCCLLFFGTSAISSLVILSGYFVSIAENHARSGRYLQSKVNLLFASQILPVIANNTSYVFQLGLLDSKLGIESDFSRVFKAKSNIDSALSLQSRAVLEELGKKDSASAREARRLLTRVAIAKLNSNKLSQAENIIDSVIESNPTALKANYIAQLISLRKENSEKLKFLLKRQRSVYRSFNTRGKRTVLASGYENEAYLNFRKGELPEADRAWKKRGRGG